MTANLPTRWEHTLLSLAYEANPVTTGSSSIFEYNEDLLSRAYAHCDAITAEHSKSFYVATSLLPAAKQRAILNNPFIRFVLGLSLTLCQMFIRTTRPSCKDPGVWHTKRCCDMLFLLLLDYAWLTSIGKER